ncbi:MAG: CTP synthase [Acidobacteriaceae bacterium]|nr:CTP synthase [Acidobacteriaceae bacterium]MBV9225219.1 CTP synthase [Acidobacteriaceae bacterium]MBV9306350.1 CTP synthase [Acidobacteriaceae bacterium]MBV9676691.1 CTP synthase [Acidobacteriaceae bacterium]MBV9938952.1 CTP synthase [Acidobacteriaceae bacterium]
MAKYIFVTGGVVSSLGKGIAAASIGCLLESRGLRVTLQKFDPYLNIDPGTMSPFQHGEVFVTDDGAETDLDLGHYERFTHAPLTQSNNLTSGRIYENIITRERRGDYLGKTVQVIPHVTNEIKAACRKVAADVDIAIVEIGGTVGDIESLPFLEAIRQMRHEEGRENTLFIHLTLVPWIAAAQELKTKPTQHSVKELRAIGIQPDMLFCRSERSLPEELKEKIALFCDVAVSGVVTARDVDSVYEIPLVFADQGVDESILRMLNVHAGPRNMTRWTEMLDRMHHPVREVNIGLVGKYVEYEDSYKSLKEALLHAGIAHQARVNIEWIESERMEWPVCRHFLQRYDGILVPGGFGKRGIEGMLHTIRCAREDKIPYFGICLGMQTMVIEFARNVCGLVGADSTEFNGNTPYRVIYKLRELKGVDELGGTMRLGAYPCRLAEGSWANKAYGTTDISERHRHRYEFNREFETILTENGLRLTGQTPDGVYVEICELPDHPWFLGCQFHPEFKSKPLEPHPLFTAFLKAALEHRERKVVMAEREAAALVPEFSHAQ